MGNKGRNYGHHHSNHIPFVEDVRVGAILMILVAVMFSVVLVFASLPGHAPVQSNYNQGASGASALFVILAMVTAFDLLYYGAKHWIGREEGRV